MVHCVFILFIYLSCVDAFWHNLTAISVVFVNEN